MVDMRENADIADVVRLALERDQLRGSDNGHFDGRRKCISIFD